MDIFGIGKAVESMMRIYTQTVRRSGRTEMMINSLRSGDRVVFNNQNEADRVNRLCRERGLDIDCIVSSPKNPEKLFDRGQSRYRTLFDHSWLEEFYLKKINDCQDEIVYLYDNLSGWAEKNERTRREAKNFKEQCPKPMAIFPLEPWERE